MDNSIRVVIKNVYGVDNIYPLCDKAQLFCGLLKQKTLTSTDIGFIKAIGFRVFVEPDNPTEL